MVLAHYWGSWWLFGVSCWGRPGMTGRLSSLSDCCWEKGPNQIQKNSLSADQVELTVQKLDEQTKQALTRAGSSSKGKPAAVTCGCALTAALFSSENFLQQVGFFEEFFCRQQGNNDNRKPADDK